jgi:hypothetical protein
MPPVPSLLELCLRTLGAAIDRYEGLGDLPEELALQLLEVRVFLVRARRAVRACVRGLWPVQKNSSLTA